MKILAMNFLGLGLVEERHALHFLQHSLSRNVRHARQRSVDAQLSMC
jgi:hypothetical protein